MFCHEKIEEQLKQRNQKKQLEIRKNNWRDGLMQRMSRGRDQ